MTIFARILISGLMVFLWLWPAFASAAGGEPSPENRRYVSFVPHWMPQAQFAGYYVAYERGIYKSHGLDVNILRGGPDRPSAEWIEKGAADFGTMFLSTGIQERARGAGLINIGQIVRKTSQLLLARKSSGIDTWEAMNGKKLGLWAAELSILPKALLRKYGVEVTVIPQSSTVNLFLRGGVDVVSAMWYNEYHTILSAGVDPEELVVFRLSDCGINFPEDGIYCLESTCKKDPEMCRRFVRASIEGWRYAFAHQEEALDIVMKYVNEANTATNRNHQRWMLDRMQDVIELPGAGNSPGALSVEQYIAVAREMQASGLIEDIPAYSDFFVNCAVAP